jgi:molybdopterin-dependent oxidoreductase alpha subunit
VAEQHQDENSAPGQADTRPDIPNAHRATGVPGAEPPAETDGAKIGKRDTSAAGLTSIWETAHRGLTYMGVRRSLRTLTALNQKDGFDCPSCAWPDPDGERKAAEFCENGAKAVASEAMKARVTPEFFAEHPISELLSHGDLWLDQRGRITHPMLRRADSDRYEQVSWEEAFSLVGRELNALASPDEASFYTSGRASNEAAFMYGLFARQYGTNNLPDCSNMCHESSGLGLTETVGIGKSTVKIEDFSDADSIFVIGQNPGTCHPRMLTELQKAARNGCAIVSVNPLPETGLIRFKNPQEPLQLLGAGTPIARLFVQVRVNGDVALFKGLAKYMIERDRETRRGSRRSWRTWTAPPGTPSSLAVACHAT